MSHRHKNTIKDTPQLITYINGFLWTLEILNDEVNHGQTYYVEEIERAGDYAESVRKHLFDDQYIITHTEIADWKTELEKTGVSFFESFIHKIELNEAQKEYSAKYNQPKRDILNLTYVSEAWLSLLGELIPEGSKVFEVFVNWEKGSFYELYQKDYLVDSDKGLFFIHFGVSD